MYTFRYMHTMRTILLSNASVLLLNSYSIVCADIIEKYGNHIYNRKDAQAHTYGSSETLMLSVCLSISFGCFHSPTISFNSVRFRIFSI